MELKRYYISDNYDWEKIDKEIFLLEKNTLETYVIAGSGVEIWKELENNSSYKEIARNLKIKYPQIKKEEIIEINMFLEKLMEKGIIKYEICN